jgi:chromate transporter
MPILIKLFLSFALIGVGAYGGGLVIIPLIQHELVNTQGWLTFNEMTQLVSVAQITPGPIAINAATFAGVRIEGVPGALVATTAVVLPSILMLSLLAPLMDRISTNTHVRQLRVGVQIGVVSLIIFATWSYGSGIIEGWLDFAVSALAFTGLVLTEGRVHPVLFILACGFLGLWLF